MSDSTGTARDKGAEMGAAGKLVGLLPGCGLEKLTDDEAAALNEVFSYLKARAWDEGYCNGFIAGQEYAECDYNGDGAALLGAGRPTAH